MYMKNTLSKLIVNNLYANQKNTIIGSKINTKWIWKNNESLLNSIHYCRDYLKYENIQRRPHCL